MTIPDVSGLPVNLDASYADDAADPSKKTHQQHHDLVHAATKAIVTALNAETAAREAADADLEAKSAAFVPALPSQTIDVVDADGQPLQVTSVSDDTTIVETYTWHADGSGVDTISRAVNGGTPAVRTAQYDDAGNLTGVI